MLIETRRDLAAHLQAQMLASSGGQVRDEVSERTHVKTYLLEAHPDQGNLDTPGLLARVAGSLGIEFAATRDSSLWALRSKDADLWCDTSAGRFWRLHTTAPVESTDRLHEQLLRSSPWIDAVWMPPEYLESFPERVGARLITVSSRHDRRKLSTALCGDSDYLSLRLWAAQAAQSFARLRAKQVFPESIAVHSVRIRSGAEERGGEYCVAEYFHHGKITVTGTSFAEHSRLVDQALADYRTEIERFERGFAIGPSDQAPHTIEGRPIEIKLRWTVADVEYAVARMFSGAPPFRLWGMPERLAEGRFRVRAVDLHVGQVLTFDIGPNAIVIQLPKGVCGNTVVRFLASLRYHVNSSIQAPLASVP